MQTLACNHLNIPGACKQGFSPLRQNQRTPSDMHAMSNTKGDSCGLRTQLAAWQTNLQCTRLTVHQHTCADTTANSTHTHTHTHTHTMLYKFSTRQASLQKQVVLTLEPGQVQDCLLHFCHSLIHVQCMQVHLECVAHLCVSAKGTTNPQLLAFQHHTTSKQVFSGLLGVDPEHGKYRRWCSMQDVGQCYHHL